jgi:hypothetical protein
MSRPTKADSVDFNRHVSWTEADAEAAAAEPASAAEPL